MNSDLASGKLEQLRDKWDQLTPQRKTFFLKWGSGLGILLAILASYYWSGRDDRVVEEVVQVDQIDLGTGMLEDDIRAEVEAKLSDVELKNQDDDQRLLALETLMTQLQSKDILDKEIGLGQPTLVKNAKILIANTPMDTDKIKILSGKVVTDSIGELAKIEKAEKDKTLSEDQRDDAKEEIQELTKSYESKVEAAAKAREKEVMDD